MGVTVQTTCVYCKATLRISIPPASVPATRPAPKSSQQQPGFPARVASPATHIAAPPAAGVRFLLPYGHEGSLASGRGGASSDLLSDVATAARETARAEEDREDVDTPLPTSIALLHWHWANLEYANGTQLHSLSNRWCDADKLEGGHTDRKR